MRGNFLRGGFPAVAVFGVEVANIKVEVAFLASKVKTASSARVDDLPLRWVESFEE